MRQQRRNIANLPRSTEDTWFVTYSRIKKRKKEKKKTRTIDSPSKVDKLILTLSYLVRHLIGEMYFLLRGVEHLSVGTFEFLHQLRNKDKRVFLSFLSRPLFNSLFLRSKINRRMEKKEVDAVKFCDPLDPRTLANWTRGSSFERFRRTKLGSFATSRDNFLIRPALSPLALLFTVFSMRFNYAFCFFLFFLFVYTPSRLDREKNARIKLSDDLRLGSRTRFD